MKTSLIAYFVFIGIMSYGQSSKLKQADEYYGKLSYAYAASLYEELIGTSVENPLMTANLARSYYFMGDMTKAEAAFAKIVNSAIAKKDDLFYYAQALKQNGKIAESDAWMNKFRNKAPNDLRGESYSEMPDYYNRIMEQGEKFQISNLAINTSSVDFGGYATNDGKYVYFVSNRKKPSLFKNEWSWNQGRFLDLYSSQVATSKELEAPNRMTHKTNSIYHEGPLAFTPDGKTVFFTRNNVAKGKQRRDGKGIQNLKLYSSSVNKEGIWFNEIELPFNSKEFSVGHPTVSADGKTLYFASDMPGGYGGADLYKVEINMDGSYGSPTNLGNEINTEGNDMFPWISKDGYLFFSSDGLIGLGGMDIFVVFPKEAGFGNVMNLGKPINSESDDFAFTLYVDNKTGYFSSNRKGGKGDDDIYSFEIVSPLKMNLNISGTVTDKVTKLIIPNAMVELLDGSGNTVSKTFVDNSGNFKFGIGADLDYQLRVSKDKYFVNTISFSTFDLAVDDLLLKKNLQMEQDPGLGLYSIILDTKTNMPLKGARVSITDLISDKIVAETFTTESGEIMKSILDYNVGDKISYKINILKEGFFPKTILLNTVIDQMGIIDINEITDGGLSMDKIVNDLSEMIRINPINFDLGNYNIRPDAKIELDKIVEIMNKYPEMEVELGSHTDCRASVAFNEKLSDQRAKASAAYIKSKITNPDRIYGKGYGESRLLNDCACEGEIKSDCSEEEHEKNRRTEFKVIKTGAENLKVINTSDDSFGN